MASIEAWSHQINSLSGVPDFFDRNKILSGGDLSHYQVPHCIRVFFYFAWFVFIHHNFQFYFELCTYCNILDIESLHCCTKYHVILDCIIVAPDCIYVVDEDKIVAWVPICFDV